MKEIIHSVFDTFELKENRGFAIVGNNPGLDNYPLSFFTIFKNKKIIIKNPDGTTIESQVIDVNASSSIADKKNIALLLPTELKGQIQLKASVWGEW